MIIIQMKHNLTFCMACDFCQCCFTFLSAIHCFENSNICLTYDYKNYSILLLKWKRHFRLRITNPREASVKSSKISALWKRYSTIVLWAKEKHHCGFPSHSVKEMIFRSTKKSQGNDLLYLPMQPNSILNPILRGLKLKQLASSLKLSFRHNAL